MASFSGEGLRAQKWRDGYWMGFRFVMTASRIKVAFISSFSVCWTARKFGE
jgi:hypothetical protein